MEADRGLQQQRDFLHPDGGSSVATIVADFERQNLYQRENRSRKAFI